MISDLKLHDFEFEGHPVVPVETHIYVHGKYEKIFGYNLQRVPGENETNYKRVCNRFRHSWSRLGTEDPIKEELLARQRPAIG